MSTASPAASPAAQTNARIVDRGYRRYHGVRHGSGAAMGSVIRFTFQRVIGLHRKARYKIFPILTVVLAYVPAVVFVGVVVLTKRLPEGANADAVTGELVARYTNYYSYMISAMILFVAFVGPEVLCPDRTNGMLGLYLASPLNRVTYLISKAGAMALALSLVTIGPPLVILIGYTTQDYGPSGFASWVATLGRLLLSGVALTAIYTAVAMAVSSLTTRRAAASATILVLMVGLPILLDGLVREARQTQRLWLLSLFTMPQDLVYRIYDERSPFHRGRQPPLPTLEVVGSFFVWTTLAVLVLAWSYRRLRVTR